MKRIMYLAAAAGLAFAAAGCPGTGAGQGHARPATVSPEASEAAAVASAGDAFRALTSYRLHFTLDAVTLNASIEGDAAYRNTIADWSRTAFTGVPRPSDALGEYLFLPPDLYLQQVDGTWYVQSPWNQGLRPAEEEEVTSALLKPVVDFAELSGHLRDVARQPDDAIDGQSFEHFAGTVDVAELASLALISTSGTASVDVWIDGARALPRRVQLKSSSFPQFLVVADFSDYDVPTAPPPAPPGAHPLRDVLYPGAPCTADALNDCLRAQTGIQGAGTCAGSERRICVVPLGSISPDLVNSLVNAYRDMYGLTVTVLPSAPIPASLEDPKRQQVDGSQLIAYIGTLFPDAYRDPQAVLIGLTTIDLFDSRTEHLRYVFGVKGTASDPKAVVSAARMDPRFYGEGTRNTLLYTRTRKFVSRYVGLLYYGLAPNPDPASPLASNIGGLDDVDKLTEPLPVRGARQP